MAGMYPYPFTFTHPQVFTYLPTYHICDYLPPRAVSGSAYLPQVHIHTERGVDEYSTLGTLGILPL